MAEIGDETERTEKKSDDLEQLRKKLEEDRAKLMESIKDDIPEEKKVEKAAFKTPSTSTNSTPRETRKSVCIIFICKINLLFI